MSKLLFQSIFDMLTGQPTSEGPGNAMIQSLAAPIPPPPPPPSVGLVNAAQSAERAASAVAGGASQQLSARADWDNARAPGAFAADGTAIPNIGGGIRG